MQFLDAVPRLVAQALADLCPPLLPEDVYRFHAHILALALPLPEGRPLTPQDTFGREWAALTNLCDRVSGARSSLFPLLHQPDQTAEDIAADAKSRHLTWFREIWLPALNSEAASDRQEQLAELWTVTLPYIDHLRFEELAADTLAGFGLDAEGVAQAIDPFDEDLREYIGSLIEGDGGASDRPIPCAVQFARDGRLRIGWRQLRDALGLREPRKKSPLAVETVETGELRDRPDEDRATPLSKAEGDEAIRAVRDVRDGLRDPRDLAAFSYRMGEGTQKECAERYDISRDRLRTGLERIDRLIRKRLGS